jgi:septation ring formation regulator EzrA
MTPEFSQALERILEKSSKVLQQNAAMAKKIAELEDQVDHLQTSLEAMQAEHSDFQDQLQQRDLALTVQSGSPARDTYSEEKIAELVREIDRCMKLLSA